jgi:hypothetical protein
MYQPTCLKSHVGRGINNKHIVVHRNDLECKVHKNIYKHGLMPYPGSATVFTACASHQQHPAYVVFPRTSVVATTLTPLGGPPGPAFDSAQGSRSSQCCWSGVLQTPTHHRPTACFLVFHSVVFQLGNVHTLFCTQLQVHSQIGTVTTSVVLLCRPMQGTSIVCTLVCIKICQNLIVGYFLKYIFRLILKSLFFFCVGIPMLKHTNPSFEMFHIVLIPMLRVRDCGWER